MDKMKITLWAEAGTPTLTRTAEGRADVVTTITGTRETIEIKEDEELRVTSEGHWKIGVINAEAAGGFTVDLQVLDPDRLYERHTLTPVGFSRFGCSLMLEGEVGDDGLIAMTPKPVVAEAIPTPPPAMIITPTPPSPAPAPAPTPAPTPTPAPSPAPTGDDE